MTLDEMARDAALAGNTVSFADFMKGWEILEQMKPAEVYVVMRPEYYEWVQQAIREGEGFEAYLLNMLDVGDED